MAEHVEVVIKIPKYYLTHPQDYSCLAECVRRGTVLPKGHGRLIDEDQIPGDGGWDFADRLMSTPTIIEADKESEE